MSVLERQRQRSFFDTPIGFVAVWSSILAATIGAWCAVIFWLPDVIVGWLQAWF